VTNGAAVPGGSVATATPPRRRPQFDGTPLLRIFARLRAHRLAGQDAPAEQRWQLRRLVSKAKDTRFGRDHGFARIT
jgi:hypothetical protein